MVLKVEHELHHRRRGRNLGLGLVLVGFVAIVFGLTVVKVLGLGDIRVIEGADHVASPTQEIIAAERAAAEAAGAGEDGE
ncbi:hypothetical protein [Wenxinia marina]|uniref:Cytochrome C oxidase assembly protein n=1 Tax=Wenxinia marina DSM 24838 TaxID=1123501 RepID=A0A0D0P8Q5_9RHOB|nr:hypothetical protein [Wenxinia marina]KIQ67956.1 hypothetical protein Wenmar_03411 [Wenxinia marina DSM 24838]GGL75923.1 hypothetical protein GCM10011392_33130 [Wenxinia marina]